MGVIELDETTQRRAQGHNTAREALFLELASARRDTALPTVKYLKPGQVEQFGKALRERVLIPGSPLAKRYLNVSVDEIVVQDKVATISGSHAAFLGILFLWSPTAKTNRSLTPPNCRCGNGYCFD